MKSLFAIAFVLLYSLGGYGQSNVTDSLKIDSLKKALKSQREDTNKVNTLNQLSDLLGDNGDIENGYKYAATALALAEKTKYRYGIGYAHYLMGVYLEAQRTHSESYPKAVMHLLSATNILGEFKNKKVLAYSYYYLALAYGFTENIPESINNNYKALELFEEINDKEYATNTLILLGTTYSEYLHNDTAALKNLNQGLILAQQSKDIFNIALIDINLGTVFIRQKHYSEALEKFFAALKIYRDSSNAAPVWGVPFSLQRIGEVYEKQGDSARSFENKKLSQSKYEKAAKMYAEAVSLRKENNDIGLSFPLTKLGLVYIKTRNLNQARSFLNKSLLESDKNHFSSLLPDIYFGLSIIDSLEGNFKASDKNLRKYIQIHDSLISIENNKKIFQSQMQYEFDKKESVAKATQDKKDAEAERIKNQQYFAIAALGIAVLAVIIIAVIQFRNNKHKQKANLLLTDEKQKVETTLSNLKSTQAQLIQSEKMASLGELTAGIAHEIQNPLNFVNNFSEVSNELIDEMNIELDKGDINEAKAIAADVKQNLEKINHHGKRADAIVKGMLQHSRTSTGVKEPTDINALADEYLRLAYHGLRAKDKTFNATLKTDFDHSLGTINIIPQDIGRVLLNLINNAFYAVDERKKTADKNYQPAVSVIIKKIDGKVEISVTDNGNGIPQNIVDKIFQPFFTTKPTGQGTGLGLSLGYDIIKAHSGEIKVETKEGEGTEFIINLPLLNQT